MIRPVTLQPTCVSRGAGPATCQWTVPSLVLLRTGPYCYHSCNCQLHGWSTTKQGLLKVWTSAVHAGQGTMPAHRRQKHKLLVLIAVRKALSSNFKRLVSGFLLDRLSTGRSSQSYCCISHLWYLSVYTGQVPTVFYSVR